MTSEFITLLAVLGAGLVLAIGFAVWWINRTPTFERTGEALPLFGGVTPGERVPVAPPAPAPALAPAPRPVRPPAPSRGPAADFVRAPDSVFPIAPAPVSSDTPAPAPVFAPREAPPAPPPAPRPRPVIREFVSGLEPAPVAAAPEPAAAPAPSPAASVVSAAGVPGTMVEGHALRFSVPADGTLQFLPGRFEIGSGLDAGREIRFVRVDGPNGTEVTFGRAEGELYRHIQLRDKTVSRAHARMHFDHGVWHLENLSQTNPVVHNGTEMPSSESRQLRDGDRVEMGEVVFTFRER